MNHPPIPTNPQPIEQVTIMLPSERLQGAAIIVAALSLLICLALAACASEPPELQTGAQCVKSTGGKAAVTDTGVQVLQEGRCIEWRFGPTKREQEQFDQRKAGRLLGTPETKDKP